MPEAAANDAEHDENAALAAAIALPVLNMEKVGELRAVLPLSTVRELMQLYMLDAENHIGQIRKRARDIAVVGRSAHVIVSTAGNIGAERVSAIARLLDHASRAGDDSALPKLIAELTAAHVTTCDAIRSWLDKASQAVA